MPFTLAHPAVVIPLSKSGLKLSLTGLIIGSMIPDFEFFFMMREVENIGHKWYGIILFDLPLSYFFAYIFHNLLRNQLIDHLPLKYFQRFSEVKAFDWNKYARNNRWSLLISIIIGISTHFALDALTHHDGAFVELFPILSREIPIGGLMVPIYFALQVLLSVLGMCIVHLQIQNMPRVLIETRKRKHFQQHYWSVFILLFSLILISRLTFWPEWNSFGGVLIAIMGSVVYSWLTISIYFNFFLKFQNSHL